MLKYILLFVPLLVFSQKTQDVSALGSIKDNTKTISGIDVINQPESKDLGQIDFKNKKVVFLFANTSAENFFKEWFATYNKQPKGNNKIMLVLEKLKFSNNLTADEKNDVTADVRASTFLEKDGKYYFLKRINSVKRPLKDFPQNPQGISITVSLLFQSLIRDSYKQTPSSQGLSLAELSTYETILTPGLAAYKNTVLTDGIYTDYTSFFAQTPLSGYQLVKNSSNEVTKAKKGDETLSSNKIYAYVENNKAYLNTAGGFLDLEKDGDGYYVTSNEGTLNPAQMSSTYGMFGLVGAGIGAIQTSAKNKAARKEAVSKIYIDALTGNYIYGK